jgi:L-fuculose-phosphate aldolase
MNGKPENKKIFLSDWELRRMNPPGSKGVNVPKNAIISPLSRDWLDYGADARTGGLEDWRTGNSQDQRIGSEERQSPQGEAGLREEIAETGRKLYDLGFVPATDGNISVRLADGSILITASGVSKGKLAPADMARISMDGKFISGRKPSSEYLLHLRVYAKRPDVLAVVHAHPPVATGLASAGIALDKPLTSEIVIGLGKVPLAPYATPGTGEVSDSITGLLENHNAIMLANHGVVTYGSSLEAAFQRMETVEQAAKITLVAEHLGGGKLIPPDKVKKLEEIRKRLAE